MFKRNRSSRGSSGSSGRYGGHSNGWDSNAADKIFTDTLVTLPDDTDEDTEYDPDIASMEGICSLCTEHLNIDPMTDIRILVLLWKMNVGREKSAHVTRQEWIEGCETLGVDSIKALEGLLPSLDTGFLETGEFREFYKFTFKFSCEGTQRTLEKDLVTILNPMVLANRIPEKQLTDLVKFLEATNNKAYARITLDQWMSFLDFSLECPDVNDYDEETSAWPTLIDDYVDFIKGEMEM